MTAIKYETQTCGRCGGSGRYSYNQIDGDRCYGCGGSGITFSKRGRATKHFVDGFLNMRADEVKPGMFVILKGDSFQRGWRMTVKTIERVPSGCASIDRETGERVPYPDDVRFIGASFEKTVSATQIVRRRPTKEEVDRAMRYQSLLTKAGKPRKGTEFDVPTTEEK